MHTDPSIPKSRLINNNINFAEKFYTNQAMPGFGEVNLRLVTGDRSKGQSNYAIIPDVKITTIPQMIIGKAQTAVLRQKVR